MQVKDNIVREDSEVFFLEKENIDKLKSLALNHPLKRSRICLHKSDDDIVHEMIIVAHQSSDLEAHRHPVNKPESYHVIEGILKVIIYNNDGSIKESRLLNSDRHPRMYRIKGNVWHQPVSMSEWVIYHEVATGPFIKEIDVEYLKL